MDAVNRLSQALAMLRREMTERGAPQGTAPKPRSTSAGDTSGSTDLREVQKKITTRIRAIDLDDKAGRARAVRIFLEGVLQHEFGDAIVGDSHFQGLVEQVQSAIESDSALRGSLVALITRLSKE